MAATTNFFVGSSKTLAESLLTKLFKGQSRFSILPFDDVKETTGANAGGIKWAGLNFEGADEIFTIKDSFSLTKAADTEEKIQIDQKKGATIDTAITERGEITFEGDIPVVCAEYCMVFYDYDVAGALDGSNNKISGYSGVAYKGQGFELESKEVVATMLIENSEVDRGLAFARVKLRVSPVFESGSPAYLKLHGTVLTNPEASGLQGAWIVLEKYAA